MESRAEGAHEDAQLLDSKGVGALRPILLALLRPLAIWPLL